MRKFLFYIHALAPGGAERVMALLASAFAQRGDDVIFAVDHAASENESFLDTKIRYVILPKGHFGAMIGLARLIGREKPDVSISGLGFCNLKHLLAALAVRRHRRAVLSYHGFFASERGLLSWLGNGLTPILTRLCARAVAVSDGLRDALISQLYARPDRTIRIYNPVSSLNAPENLSLEALASRPPTILYLGRFAPDKDIATLLHAFSHVTHPDARLHLVGDGVERPFFEAMARDLGLADRCRFLGYAADPALHFNTARCLALSSKRESFANVVAEALAYGLPVVSTACAGPIEILDHGKFGTLTPIGDAKKLGQAMEAALNAPGDPAPRQERAKLFSISLAHAAYDRLFEEILVENAKSR
jgi:glycosyltransferase involved in cell wall biosynthesis